MHVDQMVRWQSQGGGNSTIKIGKIVRVLRQGEVPYTVGKTEFPNHTMMFNGFRLPGGKNTQFAYLVEVFVSDRAQPCLYLPFPSRLMLYKKGE
ncbi:MAG: hypothetical protein IMF11_18360 [Proteobacteria bacterium]|nr:hypothetical protein [Pseudomonadota bacterium]